MFSLICVWINDWVNNREAGDWRLLSCSLWRQSNVMMLTLAFTGDTTVCHYATCDATSDNRVGIMTKLSFQLQLTRSAWRLKAYSIMLPFIIQQTTAVCSQQLYPTLWSMCSWTWHDVKWACFHEIPHEILCPTQWSMCGWPLHDIKWYCLIYIITLSYVYSAELGFLSSYIMTWQQTLASNCWGKA